MDANEARNCDPEGDGCDLEPNAAAEEAALTSRLQAACSAIRFRELASLTDFHHETVRRYVRGESTPSPIFLARLCVKLKISAEWLVLGTGPMRHPVSVPAAQIEAFLRKESERLAQTAESLRAFAESMRQ